jgi:hypothetical protein
MPTMFAAFIATASSYLRRSRQMQPTVVVAATTIAFFSLMLRAEAAITVYDGSGPFAAPPPSLERSSSYLIVDINPFTKQSVKVNQTTTNGSSSSSGNSKTPTGKNNKAGRLAFNYASDQCVNNPSPATCDPAVAALLTDVLYFQTFFTTGPAASKDAMQTFAAQKLTADLALVSSLTGFTDIAGKSADVYVGAKAYSALMQSNRTFFSDITGPNGLQPYVSNSLTLTVGPLSEGYAAYKGATAKLNDVAADTELATIKTALDTLNGQNVSAVTAEADLLSLTIGNFTTDPTPLYAIVDTPCLDQGFNSTTWTVTYTSPKDDSQDFKQTVSCFPVLSVGGMYYVDSLNTSKYALDSSNHIRQQSNNINHGSVAALLNICPPSGDRVLCGTIAVSDDATSGVSGFFGGAVLFAKRVVGINFGLRVGAANVLTNGYTLNSAAPSGATFTRIQTQLGGYVGITLNLPKS